MDDLTVHILTQCYFTRTASLHSAGCNYSLLCHRLCVQTASSKESCAKCNLNSDHAGECESFLPGHEICSTLITASKLSSFSESYYHQEVARTSMPLLGVVDSVIGVTDPTSLTTGTLDAQYLVFYSSVDQSGVLWCPVSLLSFWWL